MAYNRGHDVPPGAVSPLTPMFKFSFRCPLVTSQCFWKKLLLFSPLSEFLFFGQPGAVADWDLYVLVGHLGCWHRVDARGSPMYFTWG